MKKVDEIKDKSNEFMKKLEPTLSKFLSDKNSVDFINKAKIKNIIGISPVMRVLKELFIYLLIVLSVVWMLGGFESEFEMEGWSLFVSALLVWSSPVFLLVYAVQLILTIFHQRFYSKAKELFNNESFIPSYAGRSSLCAGIIVVDEKNKLIFINDAIFSFEDIKSMNMNNNNIDVIVRSGENPNKDIKFNNKWQCEQFFHRLSNTLGFS